jgi:Protein of unknown function (DUF3300)
MPKLKQVLSFLLSVTVTLSAAGLDGCKKSEENPAKNAGAQQGGQQAPATTYAMPTADQLYQLVAPIALFPDNLVAQVLAGSTYPDQISEANDWMKQNSGLQGDQLTQAVNEQSWDVSVKALTEFPDVLNQMASSLSWTSALGDAYFNIPQEVMNAVQVMRQRAQQAGNLKSNAQQNVTTQNEAPGAAPAASAPQTTIVQAPPQTIVIQPAQPTVVYVPTYNPAVVYGAPVVVYPGYVPPPPSTAAVVATGLISFGLGIAVGAAISNNGCCGWGYNSWGCGWHNSTVVYNRNVYVSNSTTFVNRNNYYNRNNVNVNNYNRNNVNVNNVNRNNINTNNINRNNVNRNNVNANNRTNNFNNGRNGNTSTPNFGTQHNQQQFQNAKANPNAGGRQDPGANNRGNLDQSNAGGRQNGGNLAQNQNRPGSNQQNRAGANQNQARTNTAQPRQQEQRGYGQQSQQGQRGTSSGAFSNYNQGGSTRTNSARGQQSYSGGSNQGSSRQAPSRQGSSHQAPARNSSGGGGRKPR